MSSISSIDIFQNNTFQNTLTGKDFTNRYGTKFYKILKDNCVHNGYKFIDGLNVDPVPFNPTRECSKGGFYFAEYRKIAYWLDYTDDLIYIAEVTIPDVAQIYVEQNKFKADKFILNLINKIDIKDHECWANNEFCERAIQQNTRALQYVTNQNNDICELAVQRNGNALQFVTNQTNEICKLAVQQNGHALKFVINQTNDICKIAVWKNGVALQYVINQTNEICKLAVKQSGYALQFAKEQTEEICKLAVRQNEYALRFVNNGVLKIKLLNDL